MKKSFIAPANYFCSPLKIIACYLQSLNEEEYADIFNKIENYVWAFSNTDKKRAYQRLYKLAKYLNISVKDFSVWYWEMR